MDDSSNETTIWGYANTIALENEATAGRQRRLRLDVAQQLDDVEHENADLRKANRVLAAENAALSAAMAGLLDRTDAFRRVVDHLRNGWQPGNPSEAPLQGDMDPLVDEKLVEVHADAEWPAERDRIAIGWIAWGKAQPRPKK